MADEQKDKNPDKVPEKAPEQGPESDMPIATANKTYYLVIVGDTAPEIIRCEDRPAFMMEVQKRVLGAKEQIYAFGFMGDRVSIAPPVPTCSIEIDGEVFKLGDERATFEESGKIVPLVQRDADA
jgi:hypothetical protein